MPVIKLILLLLGLCLLLLLLIGCAVLFSVSRGKKVRLQQRTYTYPFSEIFQKVREALEEEGYRLGTADTLMGILITDPKEWDGHLIKWNISITAQGYIAIITARLFEVKEGTNHEVLTGSLAKKYDHFFVKLENKL